MLQTSQHNTNPVKVFKLHSHAIDTPLKVNVLISMAYIPFKWDYPTRT